MKGELDGRDMAIATFQTELDNAKAEIEGKDNAIANLQNQLSGVVAELEIKEVAIAKFKTSQEQTQLSLFTPEPTPTQSPTPEPEPEPEQLQPAPKVRGKGKTQKLPAVDKVKTESEPGGTNGTKLLNAKQLAERINTTYSPKKPVNDHNLRDWYKSDSTCSDSYRAEKESLYHYRFSHQDAKKAYWFELLPE